ncbi:xylanase inhibitor protein 1-like [Oryza brachyantha]|uniref:xylanase inhibitor protein 1-like n=1 Tax=Oryza brachyantha TaxID=4533 RepID=UPI001ADD587B|nr:xylanase inhibitor protein 1-like [Oryza brachyantha]
MPLLFVAVLFILLAAPAAAGKTGELAVFWGRNKDEGTLREACDTGIYTTVIISFFSVFGHGNYWTDLSGHAVAGVGADIKHCQHAKNVTVLLSVGGDGDQYSLPTPKTAEDVAGHLWDAYLGGGRKGVFRPFGDAVLDGIDLYIDHGGSANYDELAMHLSRHRGGVTVLLTATVRCMDGQETSAEAALATGLVRRLHVRFYGDRSCSYDSSERRPFYGSWLGWAERYTNASVYVGLPAARDAASDGWISPASLALDALPLVQGTANYGGVMLWNRHFDRSSHYGLTIKPMV